MTIGTAPRRQYRAVMRLWRDAPPRGPRGTVAGRAQEAGVTAELEYRC